MPAAIALKLNVAGRPFPGNIAGPLLSGDGAPDSVA